MRGHEIPSALFKTRVAYWAESGLGKVKPTARFLYRLWKNDKVIAEYSKTIPKEVEA